MVHCGYVNSSIPHWEPHVLLFLHSFWNTPVFPLKASVIVFMICVSSLSKAPVELCLIFAPWENLVYFI